MLNMQNVKDIEITEGDVRTIHDKNNKLIWGRLAYDTKYAGNTIQDGTPTPDAPVAVQVVTGEQTVTVSGKNLFDWAGLEQNPGDYANATLNEWNTNGVTITGNASTGGEFAASRGIFRPTASNTNSAFRVHLPDNSTVTISADVTLLENNYTPKTRIILDPGGTSGSAITLSLNETNRISETFTNVTEGIYRPVFSLNSNKLKIENIQIEINSTATPYEPYQGHSYTIGLGSIELCKIGTYQDYIYKSGDDWYLHKEIGKETCNGSENWQYVSTSAYQFRHTISMALSPLAVDQNTPPLVFVNSYVAVSWNSSISDIPDYCVSNSGGNRVLAIRNVDYTSEDGFKAFLNSNNIVVYYPLETQIDDQVTDTTLISQLDAIHQFLTRYGYNSSVTGNLPLIINQTSL